MEAGRSTSTAAAPTIKVLDGFIDLLTHSVIIIVDFGEGSGLYFIYIKQIGGVLDGTCNCYGTGFLLVNVGSCLCELYGMRNLLTL